MVECKKNTTKLVFMRVGHASLMLFCIDVTLRMLTEKLAMEGVL